MDPITLIVLAIGMGAVVFLNAKKSNASSSEKLSARGSFSNIMGLWDISPEEQHGVYKVVYDWAFSKASEETGVPFALLKAHAIRESALDAAAYRQEPSGKASYGVMQILWWQNSGRFQKWGYSDDMIGDGSLLYQADINAIIASQIIKENFSRFNGNLRDTINAYNTGVAESVRKAPGNYVNDVLKYYSTLVGRDIS
jgi:hypothetical protein